MHVVVNVSEMLDFSLIGDQINMKWTWYFFWFMVLLQPSYNKEIISLLTDNDWAALKWIQRKRAYFLLE